MKFLLAAATLASTSGLVLTNRYKDPSGHFCGSVPVILTMDIDFTSGTTLDFDLNVKIAHEEIDCPGTAIAIDATKITFPNIATTGDCMGDALRGQKKDVMKYAIIDNGDGTLTFHSDGYPPLALTSCPSKAQAVKPGHTMTTFMGISAGENPSHYGDPAGGCQSDEVAVQVTDVDGDFCSPVCKMFQCPSDVPDGVTAKPQCALQTTSGDKYCALVCSPADAGACGTGTCKSLQGTGLCTYDDR